MYSFSNHNMYKNYQKYSNGTHYDHLVVSICGINGLKLKDLYSDYQRNVVLKDITGRLELLDPAPSDIQTDKSSILCFWHFDVPLDTGLLPSNHKAELAKNFLSFVMQAGDFIFDIYDPFWINSFNDNGDNKEFLTYSRYVYRQNMLLKQLGLVQSFKLS